MTARVSDHAVGRYRLRVDDRCPVAAARDALRASLARGRARATPRHWMRGYRPWPGSRFVYDAQRPGVCLVVRDATVVTVLTKDMFRGRRTR